jgi:CheY-like chemotaxis protein
MPAYRCQMPQTDASRAAILVVDDDVDLRESICELLADEGYAAICCDGGAAALEYLRGEGPRPDLILLDLMMPGMSGWQFRETQLREPALAAIPVVVMTASRNPRGISVDEIIFKPLQLDTLLAAVKRHGAPL